MSGRYLIDVNPWVFCWEYIIVYLQNILLYTLDISRFNVTRYFIKHKNFERKASVELQTHEKDPYLAITASYGLSFVDYFEMMTAIYQERTVVGKALNLSWDFLIIYVSFVSLVSASVDLILLATEYAVFAKDIGVLITRLDLVSLETDMCFWRFHYVQWPFIPHGSVANVAIYVREYIHITKVT